MNRIIRAASALGLPVRQGRRPHYIFVACAIFLSAALLPAGPVLAAGSFTDSAIALSDPQPGTTGVNYTFSASGVNTAVAVKCIKLVFATTATGSSVPANFDSSVAAVALDASGTNYVPTPASLSLNKSLNGTLLLTDASGQTPSGAASRTISINGITNSNVPDTTHYLRVSTFTATDCATGQVDTGTVAFINTAGSTVSLTVDPSISFSVTGMGLGVSCAGTTTTGTSSSTGIPFGAVTSAANGVICQDLVAATNAATGYSIYIRYTGRPQSDGDFVADHSGSNTTPTAFSAPGTEAYGYSTDDASLGTGTPDRFTNPSPKWAAASTTNAEVGYESVPVSTTHYQVAHQVGISNLTPAGTYLTTVIYTCTPLY